MHGKDRIHMQVWNPISSKLRLSDRRIKVQRFKG